MTALLEYLLYELCAKLLFIGGRNRGPLPL